jgi:NIMA (never in mitosis gene a)-related kinase
VDAPTGCVLGATTCEPEELAARLGTIISDGAEDDDDPMTIRAGSALCSGEDDGRGDVAMTEAETDGVVPECDGATASDATSAEKSKSGRNAKSSKSNTDGGKHSVANTDSTVSLDHDSTFINPAKFYLDGATVRLNDVDDTSCLSDRVEALRVHLERNLGQEKFVAAYRALDNLNESDDEDKVVGSLCDVMGEDISYLGLIHQLLVCEDSMHAANEGVEV